MQTKTCRQCGETLPATTEYFTKEKLGKLGLKSKCKVCRAKAGYDYYKANPDKAHASNKAWRQAYPERERKKAKAYYEANTDKVRARVKTYQEANRDEIRAKKKARYQENRERLLAKSKAWAQANPEKARARRKAWRQANPERMRELGKVASHKRRARLNTSTQHFTADDIRLQYNSQKGKCWHCGTKLNGVYHVDHLIPLARGGTNAANNIVCSCAKCNLSKHDKLPQEWNGRLF